MQLTDLPAMILPYLLLSLLLSKPYLKLPNNHHFGVWAWWSYFKTPVAKIPKNVITGNQGWFRIYLHYFFLAFFKLFGREDHLLKLRLFDAVYAALTAFALHAVAMQAGLPVEQAFVAGLLFLYMLTRPQLTSYFVNAEPFAVLFTTLALGMLLASARALPTDPVQAGLWFFAFSFVYGFTTLLNKLNHAVEYGAIFAAYCLVSGMFPLWLVAGLAGWLTASGIFILCFRRDLYADGLACFFNYLKQAPGSGTPLHTLVSHYKTYLLPVAASCGPLLFAALLGMDLFGGEDPAWQLVSIVFAASLAGLAIQRVFLFHHWIAVLPFAALCASKFLYSIPALPGVWPWIAGGALAAPLLFRLPQDLKAYFIGDAYALAKHIFKDDYWMFFDPLCPHAIELCKQPPYAAAKVMFWSIHVELYIETKRVPVCMEQPFCAASSYVFNPNFDALLLDCLPRERPEYIFDLNALGHLEHYGHFSPLLLYIRTGLRYRPKQRYHGILVYELAKASDRALKPHAQFSLMDIYCQERTLIVQNLRDLFNVRPGNEDLLAGLRLEVADNHLYDFMEESMRRSMAVPPPFPTIFAPRPLEYCSLRIQQLSWLSVEAVGAVPAPNALPIYLALMAHSIGKRDLAQSYDRLVAPEFIALCQPFSLSFALALDFLRMFRDGSDSLNFHADQGLYFSERPRCLIGLLRFLFTYLHWSGAAPAQLPQIAALLESIQIETELPSAFDARNSKCLDAVKAVVAKRLEATPQ